MPFITTLQSFCANFNNNLFVPSTAFAQTTSMCHTVAEPYSGKYLFCCSQEAIRVWSYETAIEVGSSCSFTLSRYLEQLSIPTEPYLMLGVDQCHDSMVMPRQKELGYVEVHADTTMTQDMKLMGGCIQDAFVSVWVLDVMQMRPFNRTTSNNSDHRAAEARSSSNRPPSARAVIPSAPAHVEQPVPRPTAVATPANVSGAALPVSSGEFRGSAHCSANFPDGFTRAKTPVIRDQVSRDVNHRDTTPSGRPTTPGVLVPPPGVESIPRPVRRAEDSRQSGTCPAILLIA